MDYLYDGTFDGYLTALFYAYLDKSVEGIYRQHLYAPSLLHPSKFIQNEEDKSDRVYQSVTTKLSQSTFDQLYGLYLSEAPHAEVFGLRYLRLCYRYSDQINLAKNNPIIHEVDAINRRLWLEVHRFYGFVRFKEIAPLTFYAAIEPDHHILPLLMSHFKQRFSDQNFIIHDLKRHCAIFYDRTDIYLSMLSPEDSHHLSKANKKDTFEQLFRTYYQSTIIWERKNLRQQNSYMPKRYYKHLVEL